MTKLEFKPLSASRRDAGREWEDMPPPVVFASSDALWTAWGRFLRGEKEGNRVSRRECELIYRTSRAWRGWKESTLAFDELDQMQWTRKHEASMKSRRRKTDPQSTPGAWERWADKQDEDAGSPVG